MANKRMFTMKIVDSDAFLDMPLSTQCLYFHLNMRADDDGFVGNAKRVMKVIGASDDDLKLLIAKRFVLCFEDGVIVIKHWRMHNTLSQGRYHETQYLDEKSLLKIKDNGSYSLNGGKLVNDEKLVEMSKRQTNNRRTIDEHETNPDIGIDLDKDIDKDRGLDKELDIAPVITVSKDTVCQSDVRRCVEEWNALEQFGVSRISKISSSSKRYKNLVARIKQYGLSEVLRAIEKVKRSDFLQGKNKNGWFITFDWFVLPNNFPKVLDGNYDNKQKYAGNFSCENKEQSRQAKFERLMQRIKEDESSDD